MKITATFFLCLAWINLTYAQDFSFEQEINPKQYSELIVDLYWGNITVVGYPGNRLQLNVYHTDTSKVTKRVADDELDRFVTIAEAEDSYKITSRKPGEGVFESVDLEIYVPESFFINARIVKGGEIMIENIESGLEIDHRNGSVELIDIGSHAVVNAANGSIKANFASVDPDKAISLTTLNGGIEVSLPGSVSRDVRIISRKNGYIQSDFNLEGVDSVYIVEQGPVSDSSYSKDPISIMSKINGGGALLFISTENGPVTINKTD